MSFSALRCYQKVKPYRNSYTRLRFLAWSPLKQKPPHFYGVALELW